MKNIFRYLSWLTLLLAFGLILLIGYWEVYPYKVIDFETPFNILTPEVKQGGYLQYEVKFCKYTSLNPYVVKYFVDAIIYAVPNIPATYKQIGCGTRTVQMYVPKALPVGQYKVQGIYTYKVNPLREIKVYTETELFTVI